MNRRSFLASVAGLALTSSMKVAVPDASERSPVPSVTMEPATVLEWDFTAEDFDAFVARRMVIVPAA